MNYVTYHLLLMIFSLTFWQERLDVTLLVFWTSIQSHVKKLFAKNTSVIGFDETLVKNICNHSKCVSWQKSQESRLWIEFLKTKW